MPQKNAKQHVMDVKTKLEDAKNCLNQALGSVEKAENRTKIQDTLNAVDSALQQANNTFNNYQE